MNNKNLLIICITAIIIIAIVAGTAFMIMDKQVKTQEQNTTQNNNTTKVNTTVEKISNDDNNNQAVQKDSQAVQDIKNNPNMPDDVRQRYEARQRAAEDGVPMYEYSKSPELVQKYQN